MKILYISISGNTRSFATRLKAYADAQDTPFSLKEIHDNTPFTNETEPFVVCVPTYLEGGNGIDSGDQEILTEAMRDYIDYGDNAHYCKGIIGSGNKNFNNQYCLTAKQYAAQFQVPFLGDFELRGMQDEIEKIYHAILSC
ncbi:class Ib ribonucleoside-diphosphate reductase assembly flavoprotein NrdI [Enterococcus bulliens]|uniref:class Ib ribonucleoside-diphosphate reductase assembly flavoprotein NrdI n=1 Tax=uncultured Enterococcus sp. TaxID=167972 RepID=UPI0025CC6922|nr:class Ib ribonucleoside-diphosphate reductase assembly flavoprotein NrdI [uncultured Enterococcus sp.]